MQPASPGDRWSGSVVGRSRRVQEGLLLCVLAAAAGVLLWMEGEAVWAGPVLFCVAMLIVALVRVNRGYGMTWPWAVGTVVGCGLPAAIFGWIWYGDGQTVAALAAAMVVAADFMLARMVFAGRAPARYGR